MEFNLDFSPRLNNKGELIRECTKIGCRFRTKDFNEMIAHLKTHYATID